MPSVRWSLFGWWGYIRSDIAMGKGWKIGRMPFIALRAVSFGNGHEYAQSDENVKDVRVCVKVKTIQ